MELRTNASIKVTRPGRKPMFGTFICTKEDPKYGTLVEFRDGDQRAHTALLRDVTQTDKAAAKRPVDANAERRQPDGHDLLRASPGARR
jgi:hypothetical protein